MFSFVKNFLTRGYYALFSYVSWQVQASYFIRLANLVLSLSITFLLLSLLL